MDGLQAQLASTEDPAERDQLFALIAALEALNKEQRQSLGLTAERKVVEVVDSVGEPVDYTAIYKEQMLQSESLENEFERATASAEVLKNWTTSIRADVELKEKQAETAKKKKERQRLAEEVKTLEALYQQKQKEEAEQRELVANLQPEVVAKKKAALYAHENWRFNTKCSNTDTRNQRKS